MDELKVPGKLLVWIGISIYFVILCIKYMYIKYKKTTNVLDSSMIYFNIMFAIMFVSIIVGFVLKNYESIGQLEEIKQEDSFDVDKFLVWIPIGITFLFTVSWFLLINLNDLDIVNLTTIILFVCFAGCIAGTMTNKEDQDDSGKGLRYAAYSFTLLIILLATQTHSDLSLFIMLGSLVSLPLIN